MPLLALHKEERWTVGIWQITETISELLAALPAEAHYNKRIEQFASATRRKEWLASRVLLQTLCGEHQEIAYEEDGKPYLPDSDIHISISHTKGFVALILSETLRVGVDIEYFNPRVRNIRHKFLSHAENSFIDPRQETEQLLLCWCAKETLYKLLAHEGIQFSSHLNILPFSAAHRGYLHVEELVSGQRKTYPVHYLVTARYIITTAYQEI